LTKPKATAKSVFGLRDLQGIGRLTVEAIQGVTDLVEALHLEITNLSAVRGASKQHRTRGLTGQVYRNIRSITALVGNQLDPLLDRFAAMVDLQESPPAREALLAALNGVLGDHLAARNNPLAIPMQLRRDGQAIDPRAIGRALPRARPRLLVLAHGLCMNDLQWRRGEHDHGAAIERDLGLFPIYLRYNSGLHISENGRAFSDLLETTLKEIESECSLPVELFMVGHSMGGLVCRSACHYGEAAGYEWLERLRKMVFLGSPHHGSPWEKGGNLVDFMLATNAYSAPFARLGKMRSSGITDLRHGNVLEADWRDRDRFALSGDHGDHGDHRTPAPLPRGVACYAMAGALRTKTGKLGEALIGDGLVRVNSALGRHPNPRLDLAIPEQHQWMGRDISHAGLLDHPDAYATLRKWLAAEA
jgi:hypothetical protein